MKQPIIGFAKDEADDWYAILACGHNRHMRHKPPWFNRPWIELVEGREHYLGTELKCLKCDQED